MKGAALARLSAEGNSPGVTLLSGMLDTCSSLPCLSSSGTTSAPRRLLGYLDWTSRAVSLLGSQISSADLNHLVLTKRYELLLAGAGTLSSAETEVEQAVNGLVALELHERVEAFDAAIKALRGQIRRWSAYGHYVVPDTSFYIEHPAKLEVADFGPLIEVWESTHHRACPNGGLCRGSCFRGSLWPTSAGSAVRVR